MQINHTFGCNINKDIVWRILSKYYKPASDYEGPSWLSFIDNLKDSLWSIDFFRCESILLKSHWVMVLMDQFTRRIIGLAVHKGELSGIATCVMFNKIISGKILPTYLSSDNDPIFQFQQWKANLRILDIKEIKSMPYSLGRILSLSASLEYAEMRFWITSFFGTKQICNANLFSSNIILMKTVHTWV